LVVWGAILCGLTIHIFFKSETARSSRRLYNHHREGQYFFIQTLD